MSDFTAKKVLPERSTRNKKNSWKEKDDHQQSEAARKIAPSKKKSTSVPKPLDLDSDDSLFPLATSTQIVQSETENQLGIFDEDSIDNETWLIPHTPPSVHQTASSRKRKVDSPTPSSSKADGEYIGSVSRGQKTKSAPLVVKAKSAVTSNVRRSHSENGNTNSKGKNSTTKSSGRTGSKQSQVGNNGVSISLPVSGPMRANQSQNSNFDEGVLSHRSRVNRDTSKNNSSTLRRENDSSFSTTRNVEHTRNYMDRKLTTLDLKVDYIIEKLNSMETLLQQFMKSKSQTPTTVCSKSAFPPHIRFPIENLETFYEVERLLGNSEEAKQYLIGEFFIHSDDTIFKSLIRMLKHVLSDSLFLKFTWCGSKKNAAVMKFETTKIRDCAFAAMVLKFKDKQTVLVKEFNTQGILIFTRLRNTIKTKIKNKGKNASKIILDEENNENLDGGSDEDNKGSDEENGTKNDESENTEDDEDGDERGESENNEDNDGEDSID